MTKYKTPANFCKLGNVIMGVIVLGIGLQSYFHSYWVSEKYYEICGKGLYHICPNITMERYYVSILIICFCLSIVNLFAPLLLNTGTSTFKILDTCYHGISAMLLFIGAVVYIASAVQINQLYETGKYLGRGLKLTAAAFTIIQSLLYGATTIFIAKE